jgi:chromosomal replication initiator protein
LGQLAGKRGAQQELCNWLDAIWRRDGMVVVTARTLPHQSPALLAPLRSRLAAGLAVPLAPAGPAARRVILERAAAARGLALPKRVVQMMADGWDQNVPSLLGALMELEMTARLEDGSFDAQRIRDYVAGRAGGQRLTLRAIALLTAKYFGLRLSELKSPVRRQSIVAARGVAIYLSRQLTDKSLDEIGKYFGGRDHTTVLHAFRRTERLARRDPSARHAISELKRTLSPS